MEWNRNITETSHPRELKYHGQLEDFLRINTDSKPRSHRWKFKKHLALSLEVINGESLFVIMVRDPINSKEFFISSEVYFFFLQISLRTSRSELTRLRQIYSSSRRSISP